MIVAIDTAAQDAQNAYRRARYYQRKAAGECVVCADPALSGKIRCERCASRGNRAHMRYKTKSRKAKMEQRLEREIARNAKIVRAYTSGFSHKDVARWHGMSTSGVLGVLREAGVPLRQPGARSRTDRVMIQRKVKCVEEYIAGGSLEKVGAQNRVSLFTVRRYVQQAGIPLRPRGPVPKNASSSLRNEKEAAMTLSTESHLPRPDPAPPPGDCAAVTKQGKPCAFPVSPGYAFCRIHRSAQPASTITGRPAVVVTLGAPPSISTPPLSVQPQPEQQQQQPVYGGGVCAASDCYDEPPLGAAHCPEHTPAPPQQETYPSGTLCPDCLGDWLDCDCDTQPWPAPGYLTPAVQPQPAQQNQQQPTPAPVHCGWLNDDYSEILTVCGFGYYTTDPQDDLLVSAAASVITCPDCLDVLACYGDDHTPGRATAENAENAAMLYAGAKVVLPQPDSPAPAFICGAPNLLDDDLPAPQQQPEPQQQTAPVQDMPAIDDCIAKQRDAYAAGYVHGAAIHGGYGSDDERAHRLRQAQHFAANAYPKPPASEVTPMTTITTSNAPTDTDIAITAAAERIATAVATTTDDTIGNLCIAVDSANAENSLDIVVHAAATEAKRIAEVELRQRTESAYALGVHHATPPPDDYQAKDPTEHQAEGWRAGYANGRQNGMREAIDGMRRLGDDLMQSMLATRIDSAEDPIADAAGAYRCARCGGYALRR